MRICVVFLECEELTNVMHGLKHRIQKLSLIEHVQETVKEKFGVHLETEVKRIGEF